MYLSTLETDPLLLCQRYIHHHHRNHPRSTQLCPPLLPFSTSHTVLYIDTLYGTLQDRTALLLPTDEWSQPTPNRTASTGMSGKVKRNWLATRDEYPFSPIPSIALSISTTVRYQHDQHAASGQSGPASLISNDSASCVHYKLICHAQGSKLPEPQP